uniref:Uncharacterized protein n=1 Tax=Steinernema glaseri TaxID=37863 RepID=A0A1I7YCQ1_9BILA
MLNNPEPKWKEALVSINVMFGAFVCPTMHHFHDSTSGILRDPGGREHDEHNAREPRALIHPYSSLAAPSSSGDGHALSFQLLGS